MTNVYPISSACAIENYEFPQEFIDFLKIFSPSFRSIHLKQMNVTQKIAFFEKTSRLASYQIFCGVLKINQIPGRKEFFDYYK